MAIPIEINYPDSNIITADERAVIEQHERALCENLPSLTMTTHLNYEWALDESVKSQRYFLLKARFTGETIFGRPLAVLQRQTPEELIESIEVELAPAAAHQRAQSDADQD